jgi:hypothetical protein
LLLLAGTALVVAAMREMHSFLAVNDPAGGGPLVIEGWLSDAAFQAAVAEYRRTPHERIYVTGIPLDRGTYLSKYETFAQLGAATLQQMGFSNDVVQAVPAPAVRQDRTYASAVAFQKWLQVHDLHPTRLDVVSCGAHARRTRLLYEKAMGPGVKVGIIAVAPDEYEAVHWWKSSAGFRSVTDEFIAYLYARFFFRPKWG